MAYMTLPIYNIDAAVGGRKVNRSDDVRLVQALLNAVAATDQGWAPLTPLPIDGAFTENLHAWILAFQQRSARQNPGKVVTDGVVDPIPMHGSQNWDSKFSGGAWSVMYGLNYRSWKGNRQYHLALGERLNLRDGRD